MFCDAKVVESMLRECYQPCRLLPLNTIGHMGDDHLFCLPTVTSSLLYLHCQQHV